jgi:hypothetical protein
MAIAQGKELTGYNRFITDTFTINQPDPEKSWLGIKKSMSFLFLDL